jgi:hypothetical protein
MTGPKRKKETSHALTCPKVERADVDGQVKGRPALKVGVGREVRPFSAKQICRTKGLTSADRSNKATLLLTVPRPDSSRLQRIHPHTYHDCDSRTNRLNISVEPIEPTWFGSRAKLYCNTCNTRGTNIVVSSMDSDLEAFSHNPADDSFAPLPDRTGANTKYLNERFLSY